MRLTSRWATRADRQDLQICTAACVVGRVSAWLSQHMASNLLGQAWGYLVGRTGDTLESRACSTGEWVGIVGIYAH